MQHARRSFGLLFDCLAAGVWIVAGAAFPVPPALGADAPAAPPTVAAQQATREATERDHKNMMEQLGITKLRSGRNSRAGTTNAANYDEAKANPYPDLPDALVLKSGQKVTSAEMWWKQRRPEIVEDFGREVVGRVPKDVPKVTWTVTTQVTDRVVGPFPVVA
jgi:hypothetical protein